MRGNPTGTLCERCSEDHRGLCASHVKSGELKGKRCEKYPETGATVCDRHGGQAKQIKAAAQRRRSIAKVTKVIQGEVITPITDPWSSLENLAGEAFRYFEVFKARVEELQSVRFESSQGFEQIRGEAQLMGQYMDRAQKFAETLARLPLEERRVRVTEFQMRQASKAYQLAVESVDSLTDIQRAELKRAMARELRRIDQRNID